METARHVRRRFAADAARAPPDAAASRIECLDNLAFVFKALDSIGVDHTGIGPLDVADARLELVLGLVWSLMAHVASRERDNVFKWAAITHARLMPRSRRP